MSNGHVRPGPTPSAPVGTIAGDSDPLTRARSLAPLIEAEAATAEVLGTLSPAVVDAFRANNLFWLFVPTVLGGLESDVVTFLEVIEEVSRSDGSAGWSLMANALSTGFAGSYLDDEASAAMFGAADQAVLAGMPGAAGRARPADGGYVVGGRYQFGSGTGHATWLLGGCTVSDGPEQGKHLVCCFPKDTVAMLGGWDVLGLEGTGSYNFEVSERFVDRGHTFDFSAPVPQRGGALYLLGVVVLGSAGHAGVAIGIARRALEEIAAIAAGKVRGDLPRVADQPVFQHAFAAQEASFQAARSLTWDVFRRAQDAVQSGQELSDLDVARVRQTVTWMTGVASDIVRFAYTWSGSAGLRSPSALGRCFRDVYACTQHKYVDQNTLVDAGRGLLASWATSRPAPPRGPGRAEPG